MSANEPCFVWLDLEMTGLDPTTCAIIEIGIIVTGPDLRPKAEMERAIWQPEDVLSRMVPVVREMHTRNGLLERVRKSPHALAEVERDALSLVSRFSGPGEAILAGSSVYVDRGFLARHMPGFERYLHYRLLDVTTLKILHKAWYPGEQGFIKTREDHTALSDIRESLDELRHYRTKLFKPAATL